MLVLNGCSGSSSNADAGIGPTDPTSGNGAPPPNTQFRALFAPLGGILPYPTDLYFSGTTDGTLNIPASIAALTPNFTAVNALDGYSTTADITLRFSGAIDAATLAANVRVVRVSIDNATKATTAPLGVLVPGVDYSISVSPDVDTAGTTMLIRPLRPLVASTGATNNGYLLLVTSGVHNTGGAAAAPDADYKTIRDAAYADIVAGLATPTCATITNATLNGICRLTFAHLKIGIGIGLIPNPPTNVVASWSFSTESIRDTLGFLAATTAARPYTVTASGPPFNTTAFMGLPGIVNLYNGTLDINYYLAVPTPANPTAILTTPWQAAGPSPVPGIDPASRNLTRFNPVPGSATPLNIPMLIAVPNVGSKPPNGWPVAVWIHGFPRDRTDALLIADTMASRGFATVAIDLPLHGVTPSSAAYALPFKQTPIERTFNLDFQINGSLGAPGPDGLVDTTGVNFLNPANGLVQRDNARQGIADNIALIRTIPTIDIDPTTNPGADFDGNRIHVIGYSLGGTQAGVVLGLLGAEVKASAMPSAAAMLTETIKQSVQYGPIFNALLARQGIPPNTTLYRNFFRNLQAAFDSADTVNYASTIAGPSAGGRSVFLSVFEGGAGGFLTDQTVPVSSTLRLINTVGGSGVIRINSVGTTSVAGTNGAYVPFSKGIHNSLLDPAPSPQATFELQREIADFFLSGGGNIVITDGSVIAP
jgi:dienelactone hydrolase